MRNFHKRHALMTVADWPAYLLRGVPPHTREAMSRCALEDDISLADVVRQALCARYQMECDEASFGYQPNLDTGSDVLLIRIQPEVWRALKKEAGESRTTTARYGETKKIILESINWYLEATP